ncbi:hypothetical protein DFH08DRAFT_931169 [Mycena albidolilacea]|uniref:Uncharacterized protein n=1 Tax=Mycena albidolilacea TaxID=1033008 RepID=A0AAD7AJL4_9AGAR|nr:hypothetical protein DFH08DRAFT_931169 [Mycena albidolilacea]
MDRVQHRKNKTGVERERGGRQEAEEEEEKERKVIQSPALLMILSSSVPNPEDIKSLPESGQRMQGNVRKYGLQHTVNVLSLIPAHAKPERGNSNELCTADVRVWPRINNVLQVVAQCGFHVSQPCFAARFPRGMILHSDGQKLQNSIERPENQCSVFVGMSKRARMSRSAIHPKNFCQQQGAVEHGVDELNCFVLEAEYWLGIVLKWWRFRRAWAGQA